MIDYLIPILCCLSCVGVGYYYGRGYEDRKWNRTLKRDLKNTQTPEEFFDERKIKRVKEWTDLKIYMYKFPNDQSPTPRKSVNATLEEKLKKAIEDEDYEAATKLRDQIKNQKDDEL